MQKRYRRLSAIGLLCVLFGAGSAQAQVPAGTLDRYSPSETPDDDFHVSRAADLGHLRFGAQIHLDYGSKPLVWESVPGDASSSRTIVGHQLNGTVGLSYGLWNRLVLYAGLPVVLSMGGDRASAAALGIAGPDDPGLGDASFGGRVRLLGAPQDVAALALQATLLLPTSGATGDHYYRGERQAAFRPELIGELRPGAGSRIVLNAGAVVRKEETSTSGWDLRNELTFGLGLAIPVWQKEAQEGTNLALAAQIYGATAFSKFFEREQTPLEAIFGAKFSHENGLRLGLAAGPGLSRGLGTPDFRAVFTVGYALPAAKQDEPLPASKPEEPQQEPSEPKPLTDTDGDGVPDSLDRCSGELEDVDGFQDEDGCPDPDNDGDGVLDVSDDCPLVPGSAAHRGCPEPDRDGDGIADSRDACPDEAGVPEHQGCAQKQLVSLSAERIEIQEQVHFAPASVNLLPSSQELLLSVARLLNQHPEIKKLRIEGHGDVKGRAAANREVSQKRAQAVVDFLVNTGGVARERLEAQGFGSDRLLIVNAKTEEEHAQNRRVEFHVVQDSTTEHSAPR